MLNQKNHCWYSRNFWAWLLWPFSWVYRSAMAVRHYLYRHGIKKIIRLPAPVIIVGNITVGGAGKTPLVIALAEWLRQQGWRPGLVSRGYGGSDTRSPCAVRADSDPQLVGDEAVLLTARTACPMVVCQDRVAAAAQLLQDYHCDIVISDDGLQHLALGRDIEMAVIDGERRLGNGFCLPAGPLREPAKRLKTVDFIINNGGVEAGEWTMELVPGEIYQLIQPARRFTVNDMQDKIIHAVAGIGNPQRFFNTLTQLGFKIIPHAFPDHYFFRPSDLNFGDDAIIIMTEKDAVKCRTIADERYWCLPVRAELPKLLLSNLTKKLNRQQPVNLS